MKLALLGATGATGKLLLEQALAAGHEVVAYARNPADLAGTRAQVIQGDANDSAAMQRLVGGAQAVLSALGSRTLKKNTVRSDAMKNLLAAMKGGVAKKLVWLSASGVGDSAEQARRSSIIFGRIFMPLVLKHVYADAAVADGLLRASDLSWVCARPVGLTNKPLTGKSSVLLDGSKIPKLTISRADVARFMLEAATTSKYDRTAPVLYGP